MAFADRATMEADQVADQLGRMLDTDNVTGLAFIALSTASGVIIAQEIADRVLPLLGFARDPSDFTGFAVSGVLKLAIAIVAGGLMGMVGGGLLTTTVAFIALGHLVSAGADLFNAIQRTGFFAEAPDFGSAPTQNNAQAYSDGGIDTPESPETVDAEEVEVKADGCGCGDSSVAPSASAGSEMWALGQSDDGGATAISGGY